MAKISNEQALNVLKRGAHVLGFLQELGDAVEKAQALESELAHKKELITNAAKEINDLKLVQAKVQDEIKKKNKQLKEKDDELERELAASKVFYQKKLKETQSAFNDRVNKINKGLEFHQLKYEDDMKKMRESKETLQATVDSLRGTLTRLNKQLSNTTPEALGL